MKRFWLGRQMDHTSNEMTVYDDPSETYQEAVNQAEKILKTRPIRLYVLKVVSYVQHTKTKWTHLDE